MAKEKLFQLQYNPKEDITVWELARVIGLNMEAEKLQLPIPESALETVDHKVLRHYNKIEVTKEYESLINTAKRSSNSEG